MDYSHLNSKRVAVVFRIGALTTVFRGICHCQEDDTLGNVLRVVDSDDADGHSAVILEPARTSLAIRSGIAYGCEFSLDVARSIGKIDRESVEFPAWRGSNDPREGGFHVQG